MLLQGGAVSHNVSYYQQLSIAGYQGFCMLNIILSTDQLCPVPLYKTLFLIQENYRGTMVQYTAVPQANSKQLNN